MGMTYTEFKDYLATFLWKSTDADLIANLDSLIRMGESELSRELDITRREAYLEDNLIGSSYALPQDYWQLQQVTLNGQGCTRMTANQFNNYKKAFSASPAVSLGFMMVGRTLHFVGDYADPGVPIGVYYRTKLPDYRADDASWLEDEYLDCYTYNVLKHTAPFLREDERVALWTQMAASTVASVVTDDKMNSAYAGGPLHQTMPTSVYGDGTANHLRGRR